MLEIFSSLAVWRLTYMLMSEAGPKDVLYMFRSLFIEAGNPEGRPRNWVGEMLKCFYCTSLWVAIPFSAYLARNDWSMLPIYLLGLSGIAIFINVLHERYTQ